MRIELINFRRTIAALQIIATPIGTAPPYEQLADDIGERHRVASRISSESMPKD